MEIFGSLAYGTAAFWHSYCTQWPCYGGSVPHQHFLYSLYMATSDSEDSIPDGKSV